MIILRWLCYGLWIWSVEGQYPTPYPTMYCLSQWVNYDCKQCFNSDGSASWCSSPKFCYITGESTCEQLCESSTVAKDGDHCDSKHSNYVGFVAIPIIIIIICSYRYFEKHGLVGPEEEQPPPANTPVFTVHQNRVAPEHVNSAMLPRVAPEPETTATYNGNSERPFMVITESVPQTSQTQQPAYLQQIYPQQPAYSQLSSYPLTYSPVASAPPQSSSYSVVIATPIQVDGQDEPPMVVAEAVHVSTAVFIPSVQSVEEVNYRTVMVSQPARTNLL